MNIDTERDYSNLRKSLKKLRFRNFLSENQHNRVQKMHRYISINTLRNQAKHGSDIPLMYNPKPTINNHKRTTDNYQQSINICEHFAHKNKKEKITQK